MPLKKLKAWSYSKWDIFNKCPYKFKEMHLLGNFPPPSPYADRGEKIHKLGEHFILGDINGVPDELFRFKEEFECLRSLVKTGTGFPEQQWAHDKQWRPAQWRGSSAWVRAKCDYHGIDEQKEGNIIDIVDYKTGRKYPSHEKQGKLYGVMGYNRYENVVGVHVEFWYLDQDENNVMKFDFNSQELKKLNSFWTRQGEKVMNAKTFPKKVGEHCKYCHLRDDRQGNCKAWRKV